VNKLFKNIKDVKKCERVKFPTLHYNIVYDTIDVSGMTGMVIDDEQSNIQIELDDNKYEKDLYPFNAVGFSFPEDKEYENLTVEVIDPGGFICPECGSKDAKTGMCISKPQPTTGKNFDPWQVVTQQSECASCKMIIPDHLGDRWDKMSIEEAQKEWKKNYRKTNRFQKF
jgi:hypothetical protein|tara:strand:+ start:17 stop:526 length:510 start_codon:yes stop_codon:yes gene_type:complete